MKAHRFSWRLSLVLLLIAVLLSGCGYFVAQKLDLRPAQYGLQKTKSYMVPMRDGVRLDTDVYLPRIDNAVPVILVRTPYGKGDGRNAVARMFAQRGYGVVLQDTRGRYGSEGSWYAFHNEGNDGEDTFAWLKKQPWCNGRIGLWGFSYYGYTQWRVADRVGDELTAWAPGYISSKIYDVAYRQGVFYYLQTANWALGTGTRTANNGITFKPGRAFVPPLIKTDNNAGRDIRFYNDWVNHPDFDAYWKKASAEDRWQKVNAPALVVNGWYDMFTGSTLADWEKLTTVAGRRARNESRLVIGPWSHGGPHKLAGVDFGNEADFLVFSKIYFDWFDAYLIKRTTPDIPRVQIFTMGVNQWREFDQWPPADAHERAYYLHSSGHAERMDDGRLDRDKPSGEDYDRFTHDPKDPVPSIGGGMFPFGAGPADASANGKRDDVLVYTGETLNNDLEATGPVNAKIWFSADTPDCDIAVTLLDVHPNGEARVIADGIARASARLIDRDSWLTPDYPVEMNIDMWATSHVFRKGHKLRIHIAASNYPRYAPNPCTRANRAETTNYVKAHLKVYHDKSHPSRVLLSVR
ncbi:MAG TPA: CocE/NonD family hydrolase [bacterium]|nr:CocE/NonD family hydrolase [bacterium]